MKFILSLFFSVIFVAAANAGNLVDRIKIGSNATTAELEIRYNSNNKKNLKANVLITDADGKEVSAFTCEIKKGSNSVCLLDALKLKEGIYTVKTYLKNMVSTAKILIFN